MKFAVVFATNAYTRHLVPSTENIIVPVRGQVFIHSDLLSIWWQVLVSSPTSQKWPLLPNTAMNDGFEYLVHRTDRRVVGLCLVFLSIYLVRCWAECDGKNLGGKKA